METMPPNLSHLQTLDRHEDRIEELRTQQTDHAIQLATLSTRVDDGFEDMKEKIDGVNKTISRLAWLIVTAVVVAALHLVLK
jgi:hypothetical protein